MEVRACLGARGQKVGQCEWGDVFPASVLFLSAPAVSATTCFP